MGVDYSMAPMMRGERMRASRASPPPNICDANHAVWVEDHHRPSIENIFFVHSYVVVVGAASRLTDLSITHVNSTLDIAACLSSRDDKMWVENHTMCPISKRL